MNPAFRIITIITLVLLTSVALAATGKSRTISQYGITWTFDKAYPVGQFINGDWWVVGPVTVITVTPKPGPVSSDKTKIAKNQFGDHAISPNRKMRNGSAVVLTCSGKQGYDSRLNNYDPELSLSFPFKLKSNRSLISTISREDPSGQNLAHKIMWHSEKKVRVVLETAAVLTSLPKAPPADAFRPPYAGTGKILFREKDLQWQLLQNLKPAGTPPDWKDLERYFQRPWLDHMPSWITQRMSPNKNQPCYGREWGRLIGLVSLALQLDVPGKRKRKTVIGLVQLGIDIHGLILTGRNWMADGGHWSGRKWPLIFAGIMLKSKELQDIPAEIRFQEDQQTYYGKGWCGQTALYQMVSHHGPRRTYEEREPGTWDKMDKRSEGYRVSCTAQAWIGIALAARLMKAAPTWKHNAFFDYCDRWMTVPDPYAEARGKHKRPGQEGKTYDAFVDAMWHKYRATAPELLYKGDGRKWIWIKGQQGKWIINNKGRQ